MSPCICAKAKRCMPVSRELSSMLEVVSEGVNASVVMAPSSI